MNQIYQGRVSKVEIPNALALSPSAIAPKVYWIRHEKALLDHDLAALYGVTTFNLNKAVKRNSDRFFGQPCLDVRLTAVTATSGIVRRRCGGLVCAA